MFPHHEWRNVTFAWNVESMLAYRRPACGHLRAASLTHGQRRRFEVQAAATNFGAIPQSRGSCRCQTRCLHTLCGSIMIYPLFKGRETSASPFFPLHSGLPFFSLQTGQSYVSTLAEAGVLFHSQEKRVNSVRFFLFFSFFFCKISSFSPFVSCWGWAELETELSCHSSSKTGGKKALVYLKFA